MSPPDPSFVRLFDLASERLGGRAVGANDEFFAPKENLLKVADPVFLPDSYTERGKWMDGWETRRRREPGHDWCVVRLGVPGEIRGVDVDTTHFKGNHPEAFSLDGVLLETEQQDDGIVGGEGVVGGGGNDDPGARVEPGDLDEASWSEILPRTRLRPHASNLHPVLDRPRCSHLRLNIHPDGGVARLRVYGIARPDRDRIGDGVDLAAALHGGLVLGCSDDFFSEPRNLLMPGSSSGMSDGWETRRRRGPGHDWVVLRLGRRGVVSTVEVDTSHFKGNYPASCSVEVADLPPADPEEELERNWDEVDWAPGFSRTELGPDAIHELEIEPEHRRPCSHVRFNIFPDGGVARLRLRGSPEDRQEGEAG